MKWSKSTLLLVDIVLADILLSRHILFGLLCFPLCCLCFEVAFVTSLSLSSFASFPCLHLYKLWLLALRRHLVVVVVVIVAVLPIIVDDVGSPR